MSDDAALRRIREAILREWRGADEPLDLEGRVSQPGKFLRAILQQAGATEGLDEDEVRSTWKELAGDFISRHTEPVSVKGGHLVLRVTQPAMRFHLEQMKPMLLTRIREALGAERIHSVRFQIG
jgi:predicted nucleic acid-binding Zn ribbon protein